MVRDFLRCLLNLLLILTFAGRSHCHLLTATLSIQRMALFWYLELWWCPYSLLIDDNIWYMKTTWFTRELMKVQNPWSPVVSHARVCFHLFDPNFTDMLTASGESSLFAKDNTFSLGRFDICRSSLVLWDFTWLLDSRTDQQYKSIFAFSLFFRRKHSKSVK